MPAYSVSFTYQQTKKALLTLKPIPQILCKSKYPDSKISKPDNYYTKANLYLEYICQDIRSLNFICHGNNTDLVIFDTEWRLLQMESYLEEIMGNQNYSINIKAPVLSRRDKIDIKDTIALLKRKLTEKAMKPEIEVLIPKPKFFSDLQEAPVQTRAGRKVKKNLNDMALK